MENENKDYVELPVTGGYVTKIDPDIVEKINDRKIFKRCSHPSYAAFKKNYKSVLLHRFILNASKGQMVDHINGDTFDNRRENLRFCDNSINALNRHSPITSISGFRGVAFRKDNKKFNASMTYKYKRHICQFSNKYIAAIYRDFLVSKFVKNKVSKNFEKSIHENDLFDFIESTNGLIFKICFVKRSDGSFREMLCRTRVSKNINGKGMAFDPGNNNLSIVYDMQNKSYKCVPLENIVCLKFEKENYLVTRKRLVA